MGLIAQTEQKFGLKIMNVNDGGKYICLFLSFNGFLLDTGLCIAQFPSLYNPFYPDLHKVQ